MGEPGDIVDADTGQCRLQFQHDNENLQPINKQIIQPINVFMSYRHTLESVEELKTQLEFDLGRG